jgi:pimeloyl-ACP methyl ester carboxylesterase
MQKHTLKTPEDYIIPLNINGMEGRMLRLPPRNTKLSAGREVLFIYGHHSSLERWWGLALVLNRYGAVTMPDLPGFGGMDSFYKLHKKPSLDNMADYLASFIKMQYKKKKLVIVGCSFGFVVVTRMLQRSPELAKKVTLVVSIVGFAHKDDFKFSRPRYYTYLYGTRMLSHWIPAQLFRHTVLQPWVLNTFYSHTHNAKNKFALAETEDELAQIKEMEVGLWHGNDVRTWAYTTAEFLMLDNCRYKVDVPLWHISAKNDHYFDHSVVEQHLKIIFSNYNSDEFDLGAHTPSVIADEATANTLLPPKLRRYLAKLR